MRLTLITGTFPLRSQAFIVNKAVGLMGRGHDVTVVATRRGDHAPPPGLHVEYLDAAGLARGGLRAVRVGGAGGAVRLVRGRDRDRGRRRLADAARHLALSSYRADVVHFEWATKAAAFVDVIGALDCPVATSCRGTDVRVLAPTDPEFAARLSRAFEAVDGIHCVSGAVAAAAATAGAPSTKIRVVRPAVDPAAFRPPAGGRAAAPVGVPVHLASVGRLHWVKGYEYAFLALRRILDSGVAARYSILGPYDEATAAARLAIGDLGLDEHVDLLGPGDPDQVRRLLAGADVFLLPSLSEGLSNAALEAMATGLPVVATDVGGMAEALSNGTEGFLVPSRDPAALADAVCELALDGVRRLKMGASARARVLAEFGLDWQLGEFEAWYGGLRR